MGSLPFLYPPRFFLASPLFLYPPTFVFFNRFLKPSKFIKPVSLVHKLLLILLESDKPNGSASLGNYVRNLYVLTVCCLLYIV